MKVALVHDWLVAQRGGEQVLLELCRLFPDAPIFTLVHAPGSVDPEIEAHPIHTTFVQRLPGAPRRFRGYLPLFAAAVETIDLSDFELVLSTSHCVASAVRTHPGQLHVAYVHTPMRYIWDQLPAYAGRLTPLAAVLAHPLRLWNQATARRPDVLVANSEFVRRRIARTWGRDAHVIHPPVDVDFFAKAEARERRGYLVVSALVPYKRVELAVQLASERRLELTVIGQGPEAARLSRLAGPTVRFVPWATRQELRDAYAGARALVFPGVEDFGITPIEAMAAGCPVLALGEGGVRETVQDGKTGVFFATPTVAALSAGLDELEALRARGAFRAEDLRARARAFSRRRFAGEVLALLGRYGQAPAPLAVEVASW